MFRKIFFLLFIPLPALSQLQKAKIYSYKRPPEDSSWFCHTYYHFFDSTGYWITGCENHLTGIGKFVYYKDSVKIYFDFVHYTMYNPLIKLVKKNIPGKKDISVRVFDVNGEPCNATVGVVKLGRKKDSLTKEFISHDYAKPINFPYKSGKRIFWTLSDLYPIFFAELHFRFDKSYNYYELHIDLPHSFFYVTEGKFWVGGKGELTIIDETHFKYEKDIYECYCK
jgi:hypothetical protein